MKNLSELMKMKKNILLFSLTLSPFMGVDAQAQELCREKACCVDQTNFYAKVLSGVNFLQNSDIGGNKATYQTGYIVDGALGYAWCYGLCFEAEYAFRRNAIQKIHLVGAGTSKHGHLQTSSYMANLLWDFPVPASGSAWGNIQPFIGAGIGYDFEQMHASNSQVVFSQQWHHFSWQAMAGVGYPIFCNTEITLEYKFHEGGSHFLNHTIGVGLVYKFGFSK